LTVFERRDKGLTSVNPVKNLVPQHIVAVITTLVLGGGVGVVANTHPLKHWHTALHDVHKNNMRPHSIFPYVWGIGKE
jgi:hypothetical protein